jgi:radical SAM superfamily enzyme YgiQ (UPF0313 family)
MAIIQKLIRSGYPDTSLFDIDGLRPPYKDIIAHFQREHPDVVGISGVVSTSYEFIKQFIGTLHVILPETSVIVGGNVAANAEILLRLAKADYCVIGEGELTIVDLVNYLKKKGGRSQRDDYQALRTIPGLTFKDENDVAVFTGYRPNIPADGLYDLDYDILKRDTDINRYIIEPWFYVGFAYDPRSIEPQRKGKKLATIVSTKGCVAKCTFCHRWDKGIRFVGVDRIIERIKSLQQRYNVGFISFADENFGSDHKWVDELLDKITPLDVLWRVGGVRCRSVNLDMLKRMRDAGCVNVQYGIESGSQRMLDVMEKNTKVEHNLNAAKWTYEAGLYTAYSMVIAMPGECPETIQETIEFLKDITEFLPEPPYGRLSMNRLEALPGTPVYEYGKVLGLIGRTPEEEEKYLLHISDTAGSEKAKQLNFTDYPDFIVQSWFRLLWIEVMHNWYRKHPDQQMSLPRTLWNSSLKLLESRHIDQELRFPAKDSSKGRELIDTFVDKDFNTRRNELEEGMIRTRYHTSLYFLRHFLVLEVIGRDFFNREVPKSLWFRRLGELLVYYIIGPKKNRFTNYQSMRKTMNEIQPEPLSESERNLVPLQLGR